MKLIHNYHAAICTENIGSVTTQIKEDEYYVPSEKGTHFYTVNISNGLCECENGCTGRFCKHMAVVYVEFAETFTIKLDKSSFINVYKNNLEIFAFITLLL